MLKREVGHDFIGAIYHGEMENEMSTEKIPLFKTMVNIKCYLLLN